MSDGQAAYRTITYLLADPVMRLETGSIYRKLPDDHGFIYDVLSNPDSRHYVRERLLERKYDVDFIVKEESSWDGHKTVREKVIQVVSTVRRHQAWERNGDDNIRDCIGSFVQRRKPFPSGSEYDPHKIYRLIDCDEDMKLYLTTAKDKRGFYVANTDEYVAIHPEVSFGPDGRMILPGTMNDLLVVEDDDGFVFY